MKLVSVVEFIQQCPHVEVARGQIVHSFQANVKCRECKIDNTTKQIKIVRNFCEKCEIEYYEAVVES